VTPLVYTHILQDINEISTWRLVVDIYLRGGKYSPISNKLSV